MVTHFNDKLRDEIYLGQKRRHDFIIRKLTFCTSLLGLGSMRIVIKYDESIYFTPLLFLVPIIAIAFDLYIISEDYGIKRAGEFISRQNRNISKSESDWEGSFLHDHKDYLAPFAFYFITLIMLAGSLLQLINHYYWVKVLCWATFIVFFDTCLLVYNLSIRNKLKLKSR
jgi:hypothetical protein